MFNTRVTKLLHIKYPIIQAGMVWVSGAKLAAAVSNAGGLGLIGAGSMHPELLDEHISKARELTDKPFGVNIPLISPYHQELVDVCLNQKITIIVTSAGNPERYTHQFHDAGAVVIHVIPNVKSAEKAADCGVDAVVAEGFEAGGHNGKDEITTMTLIPQVVNAVDIPVIAAGGIADGRGMLAAMALGAEGVQVGTRFAASEESSAHDLYKQAIVNARDNSTMLAMKKLIPVRILKNQFYKDMISLEEKGMPRSKLLEFLGKGRAKAGIFEGNINAGEVEFGQIAGLIRDILPAKRIIEEMISEFESRLKNLNSSLR